MYATSDYEDEAIEKFYEEIEVTMDKVHNNDLIIQGDWNAVVEDCNDN